MSGENAVRVKSLRVARPKSRGGFLVDAENLKLVLFLPLTDPDDYKFVVRLLRATEHVSPRSIF
jgi:hypothetical protein